MTQLALKLKSYGGRVSIVDNGNLRKRILYILISSGGALALLYVLMLGTMVFNIVERRSLEADARTLSNEVNELELTYLSATNKVDLALSASLGFKETRATFATRKSLGSIEVSGNDL